MSKRKYVRIALSEDDYSAFMLAKSRAEDNTGVSMTNSMFALGLIRYAIRDKKTQ
jgi:hypothetical protein